MPQPTKSESALQTRGIEPVGFVRAADVVRFWLGRLVQGAQVLGDETDAPVRLMTSLTAVELNSIGTFLDQYDDERAR